MRLTGGGLGGGVKLTCEAAEPGRAPEKPLFSRFVSTESALVGNGGLSGRVIYEADGLLDSGASNCLGD